MEVSLADFGNINRVREPSRRARLRFEIRVDVGTAAYKAFVGEHEAGICRLRLHVSAFVNQPAFARGCGQASVDSMTAKLHLEYLVGQFIGARHDRLQHHCLAVVKRRDSDIDAHVWIVQPLFCKFPDWRS
ncbi:hypothetical protein L0Z26_21765 [Burkholderia multivorans]|uniref:hypothetical protein n=1 Tax=Burkholderia multivorans TaxID=87883 RepID=UPI0020184C63|nr:hypothetical protein [Burkholderia multivorans]MCO1344515.1 hypothetical protein [Burkholderia multivorans]MCO1441837.1 hypothetical protein [Burkholderia multivorans]UQO28296.1 hypothetical protein L0Z21_15310 [Burkholderia multivorans]UQO41628.1 hypothetical protein L0Z43_15850 [Burkholderia multivorans]